ncbi:MAG: dihydropteroate synthase [Syntrophobacterales bacterium]|nr:dihydropteroate synthase [Syntrophobacterales bacterium]
MLSPISDRRPFRLELPRGRTLVLGDRTYIMGVINVTPDSFSDGGKFYETEKAVERAKELIEAGADIIDIGGESTRPFSDPIPLEEELSRTIPVIEKIRLLSDIPISIDTTKAEVARKAIEAGADIINDVSSLRFDPEMVKVAANAGVPVVLMHMLGTPKTMQENPHYECLFGEIISFLQERIQYAVSNGIRREQIIIDPGIGFGKTVTHNLRLIRDLNLLSLLERPILLGLSRKRFIGTVLNRPIEERELGTAVANTVGIMAGAHILRVHDVAFQIDAIRMADAIRRGDFSS